MTFHAAVKQSSSDGHDDAGGEYGPKSIAAERGAHNEPNKAPGARTRFKMIHGGQRDFFLSRQFVV